MQELFEQEYAKIESSLFLVAMGYLHNSEDAKDALQEAVIAAYQSYGSLKNPQYFKTWLTRIVINKSKDFLRKQRFTEAFTDEISVFSELPTADFEMMDAICRLGKELSKYITLRFYGDMTYQEVAAVLNMPVSSVKYRTKVAMNKLKHILEGEDAI